jgi:hypothetical protein
VFANAVGDKAEAAPVSAALDAVELRFVGYDHFALEPQGVKNKRTRQLRIM